LGWLGYGGSTGNEIWRSGLCTTKTMPRLLIACVMAVRLFVRRHCPDVERLAEINYNDMAIIQENINIAGKNDTLYSIAKIINLLQNGEVCAARAVAVHETDW